METIVTETELSNITELESGVHRVLPRSTRAQIALSKFSHAARQLAAARLRLSAIFEVLEGLVSEMGDLYDGAGIPSGIGDEIGCTLISAIVETRTMLGDELFDDEWLVAENAPTGGAR